MIYFFKLLIDKRPNCFTSVLPLEGTGRHGMLLICYCLLHSGKESYFVFRKMFPVMFFLQQQHPVASIIYFQLSGSHLGFAFCLSPLGFVKLCSTLHKHPLGLL